MTQFEELTPDLARLRIGFVNVYFVGAPGGDWTLVDGGLSAGASTIQAIAASRFAGQAPAAVILTHGHFDHVGALPEILKRWPVPVYAHPMELPFITGAADYPAPDAAAGETPRAQDAVSARRKGIDLGRHVHVLPESDAVPFMDGWRWIHTPGHTPGHVSLFRESDRAVIAGDAVMTTTQEGAFSVMGQQDSLSGPVESLSSDRATARRSIAALAVLRPAILAAGHGRPMRGAGVADDLQRLAREFDWRPKSVESRPASAPAAAVDRNLRLAAPAPPRRRGLSKERLLYAAVLGAAVAWFLIRRRRRSSAEATAADD